MYLIKILNNIIKKNKLELVQVKIQVHIVMYILILEYLYY